MHHLWLLEPHPPTHPIPLTYSQAFLPLLRQSQPPGRIINVSSMAGTVTRPLGATYSCTKFALEALSDTLRVELGHLGVSVSVIQPGYIRSEIFSKADEQHKERLKELPQECKDLYGHFYTFQVRSSSSKSQQAFIYLSTDPSPPAVWKEGCFIICCNIRPVLPSTHPPTHRTHSFFHHTQERDALVAKASDPIVTSQAIQHALTSAYPHTRYMVGNVGGTPAALLGWGIWLLNDRLLDRVITPKAGRGHDNFKNVEMKEEVEQVGV